MTSFLDASRAALVRIGRDIALRFVNEKWAAQWHAGLPPLNTYQQPVRLIPGMPAAPEPCCLPVEWAAGKHPRDAMAQLKVDGIRALYVDTSIVSRNAIPLDCALHCLPALHELEKLYGQAMVFDGEYLEPEGFQATLSSMRRGTGAGTIWLFDAVPYAEWAANSFTERLDDRVRRLCQLEEQLGSPFVRSLGLTAVPEPADAVAYAESVWARQDEGIVIKSARDTYYRGKSAVWQKLKARRTFDCVVVDALLKDSRCQALMVKMPADAPSPGKLVRIGSNIPDDLREHIARVPYHLHGAVVEIGFSDTTDTGNLRGGFFIRARNDKTGDTNA